MLHGCNIFRLRAKWSRGKRKFAKPAVNIPLTARADDIPMNLGQYMISHVHLAQVWKEKREPELTWFLGALRGELPPQPKQLKNYHIKYITLPAAQYHLALEVLTTRLNVRPQDAVER